VLRALLVWFVLPLIALNAAVIAVAVLATAVRGVIRLVVHRSGTS
jgi:hypothetical protein